MSATIAGDRRGWAPGWTENLGRATGGRKPKANRGLTSQGRDRTGPGYKLYFFNASRKLQIRKSIQSLGKRAGSDCCDVRVSTNGISKWPMAARIIMGLILLGAVSTASAQTIKLATIAPEGSSWMDAMRAGAAEIDKRTAGRVKFKFYGGGVQGNDRQVLRKIRIGQLHGGAFTANGLIDVQKDSQLYALPMLFNNLEEVQFVRTRMDAKLRDLIEQAGYVNFGFAGGGFARLMSNKPIANLKDLQGKKVWIPDGDRFAYEASKALGISPVLMPLTDVMTGLQTELIDTIMSPPAATIILQWNTKVSYITELPVSYIFAMIAIDKKYFDRIQTADQAIVREVMEKIYQAFDHQGNEDNQKAYKALIDNGMKPVTPDQGQVPEWRKAVQASNRRLAEEGAIDISLLDELDCYLDSFRTGDTTKICTQ
ncbi:MAG: TRAP transporter substrate-binding protein DctP [Lysobacterales bacterium]